MTEEVNPGFHQFLERGVSVDVQWLGSAQERKRGNQWHQSQNMVAVQMRQKDVRKFAELQMIPSHRKLRAFSTINHEKFLAQVNHLCAGIVAQRWKRASTTKNVDFKLFHKAKIGEIWKN